MIRFRSRTLTTALFALALVFAWGSGAQAQAHLGLLAGGYQPDEDDESEADITLLYGLEGGWRFNSRFGLSASVSRVDLAEAFGFDDFGDLPFSPDIALDLTNLDLSFEWYPAGGNFVILGGPGLSRLEFDIDGFGPVDEPFSFSETEELLSVHLGLGYQWNLTDRLSLRPEARARRIFDDEEDNFDDEVEIFYDATDLEARVTLSYRFGA